MTYQPTVLPRWKDKNGKPVPRVPGSWYQYLATACTYEDMKQLRGDLNVFLPDDGEWVTRMSRDGSSTTRWVPKEVDWP